MSPDDLEEKGKKRPFDESDALEEAEDEVEYEPISEGEDSSEKAPPASGGPHGEEDKGLKSKLKKREAENRALKKENDELKDKYLRALAEMENLRKRLDRERTDYTQYALSEFLREALVVLDNFERALKTRNEADGKSFQEGVELIYRQFQELLRKNGVRPIEPVDKKFDPAVQHAVLIEESGEVEEPEVVEELQRGYWIRDRLLRPAMVKVLVPKKRTEE